MPGRRSAAVTATATTARAAAATTGTAAAATAVSTTTATRAAAVTSAAITATTTAGAVATTGTATACGHAVYAGAHRVWLATGRRWAQAAPAAGELFSGIQEALMPLPWRACARAPAPKTEWACRPA